MFSIELKDFPQQCLDTMLLCRTLKLWYNWLHKEEGGCFRQRSDSVQIEFKWCRSWNVSRGNLRTFKVAAFTGVSILRLCLQDSTVLRSENRRQYLPCLLLNIFVEWIRRSSVNLARHLHGERGILMVVVFRYLTFAFCHVDSGEHKLSCRTWNSFLYP